MLKIVKLTKIYNEKPPVTALDNLSLEFPDFGFVSIIGSSGCGKTTLLNIIGGLDNYNSGDLIINQVSTAKFSASDWDNYRSSHIGFIFQNSNLVNHLSIEKNIELPLTLSGEDNKTSIEKVNKVIQEVGLTKHINKSVTHLSGGEKQRVEIARALVKNPQIILADEPTGSFDEETSREIMGILREIAKTRLVILVTHKRPLAKEFSDRIIELENGKIIKDKLVKKAEKREKSTLSICEIKKNMSFGSIIKLSFANILSKRFRTIAMTIAMAIGICSLSLVLALTTGFGSYAANAKQEQVGMPITVNSTNNEMISSYFETYLNNEITDEYYSAIRFDRVAQFNLLAKNTGNPIQTGVSLYNSNELNFQEISYVNIADFYDIEGTLPQNKNQILLVTDQQGRINAKSLAPFGLNANDDIIGRHFTWLPNDSAYIKTNGTYKIPAYLNNSQTYENYYNNGTFESLEIVGIIIPKQGSNVQVFSQGFAYLKDFTRTVVNNSFESAIVRDQLLANTNVLTGESLTANERDVLLTELGYNEKCDSIAIYAKDLKGADEIKILINNFNNDFPALKVGFTDLLGSITKVVSGITSILLSLSIIFLIVSAILFAVISYITVQARAIEIAIMRSLGAKKSNISFMIIMEIAIIGLFAGIIGIAFGFALLSPFNIIINSMISTANVAKIAIWHPFMLVGLGLAVTLIVGIIPASSAARKDPSKILRSDS